MTSLTDILGDFTPETVLVLGSGLGGVAGSVEVQAEAGFEDIDGFPVSGVSGHSGRLLAGTISGHPVALLSGRVHYYEAGDAAAMREPIEALAAAGAKRIILTNSAGSLDEHAPPGSVMQITDHINFSGTNPLIGESTDRRFVGLTNAYDDSLQQAFRSKADALGIELHQGVYMWFSGPTFETPAEIRMARAFGANAVGMSTVPEVILARFFDMEVAAFSIITNFAAGMTGNELSHTETKEVAPQGGEKIARLLSAAFESGF